MILKKIINKHNPKTLPFFDFRNDPSKNRAAMENTKSWRDPPTSPPYFPNIPSKIAGVYHIIKKYNTWIRYGFNLLTLAWFIVPPKYNSISSYFISIKV
jgi:hypothetical protein